MRKIHYPIPNIGTIRGDNSSIYLIMDPTSPIPPLSGVAGAWASGTIANAYIDATGYVTPAESYRYKNIIWRSTGDEFNFVVTGTASSDMAYIIDEPLDVPLLDLPRSITRMSITYKLVGEADPILQLYEELEE
jgi:hypothetical protein